MPTPLPPNTQLTHMPAIGDRPASGFRLSMLRIDRAAGHVGGDRREGGAGGRPETQFLALEIAEMLVDRQRGDGRARHVDLAVRRRRIGDLIGPRRRARSGPDSAACVSKTMTQTMSPAIIASITP